MATLHAPVPRAVTAPHPPPTQPPMPTPTTTATRDTDAAHRRLAAPLRHPGARGLAGRRLVRRLVDRCRGAHRPEHLEPERGARGARRGDRAVRVGHPRNPGPRGRRHRLALRQRLRGRSPRRVAVARRRRRPRPRPPARLRPGRRRSRRRTRTSETVMTLLPKRMLVGRPLRSDRLDETLLPKRLALPVFCSDPLSSVAYATEQIVLVLGLGGLALLHLTPWVAAGGGGAARHRRRVLPADLLRLPERRRAPTRSARTTSAPTAALVAASALLVDYVLTVAGQRRGGRRRHHERRSRPGAARGRAVPAVRRAPLPGQPPRRQGVRHAPSPSRPTGSSSPSSRCSRVAGRQARDRRTRHRRERAVLDHAPSHQTGGLLTVFLVLRAFASGCTALTGVEADQQRRAGVPAAEEPQRRADPGRDGHARGRRCSPASRCSAVVGQGAHGREPGGPDRPAARRRAEDGAEPARARRRSARARPSTCCRPSPRRSSCWRRTPPTTASRCSPRSSAATATCPRQLARPRRPAGVQQRHRAADRRRRRCLIVAFDAQVTRLIQLYIIGVFVSFTLSQLGMVRHWQKERRAAAGHGRVSGLAGPAGHQRPRRGRDGRRARHRAARPSSPTEPGSSSSRCRLLFLLMKVDRAALRGGAERAEARARRGAAAEPGCTGSSWSRSCTRRRCRRSPTRRPPTRTTSSRSPSGRTRRRPPSCSGEWPSRGVPVDLVVLDSPYREMTPPGAAATSATSPRAEQRVAGRRRGVRPRVRRRPVVGAAAAQPERAAAEGPAAVRARGRW